MWEPTVVIKISIFVINFDLKHLNPLKLTCFKMEEVTPKLSLDFV